MATNYPVQVVVEGNSMGMDQSQDNGGGFNVERNAWGDFSDCYGMDTSWSGFGFPGEGTAWLSQQLVDLDWMDLPWLPPD